jgi:hypothetical protein
MLSPQAHIRNAIGHRDIRATIAIVSQKRAKDRACTFIIIWRSRKIKPYWAIAAFFFESFFVNATARHKMGVLFYCL